MHQSFSNPSFYVLLLNIKFSLSFAPVEKTASERCLKDINTNITPMSMEIRTGKDEITGNTVYALVRTTESELGRLSTDYTEKEREFFKKMVRRM